MATSNEPVLGLPFLGSFYSPEPDFSRKVPEIPGAAAETMQRLLGLLYPGQAPAVFREVARLIRVHLAHASPEILAIEGSFDPRARFSVHDVVLITYGDLLVSGNRTPLRTLADFTELFFHDLITTVHILPFFPYSSDRGFSVISFEEVDAQLGSWEEILALGNRFKLMFDGVFNHVSAKSYWFQQFLAGDPDYAEYFTAFASLQEVPIEQLRMVVRPRTSALLTRFDTIDGPRWVWTTFSADQVDLNFRSPKVLLKVLEILMFYVRRGADLIRLDAVTYLWDELGTSGANLMQTHVIVKLFRAVLDVAAPHVALVSETNVPHEENISYFGDGSDEAQMVYNFALPPLVLHAFQTGSAAVLSRWAAGLEPPSATTTFFNFLDSHDGIGINGARGILGEDEIAAMVARVVEHGGLVSEKSTTDGSVIPYELNITWFSALNRENGGEPLALQVDRFIASRAIALALRGVPGIYLPSLFGHRNDAEAVGRDGCKRSINRAAVDEQALLAALGDRDSSAAAIAARFIALLVARTSEPAFHPAAPQRVLSLDERVFVVLRTASDRSSRVLALTNVSSERVTLHLPLADCGFPAPPVDLLGAATPNLPRVEVHPFQVLWLHA